MHELNHPAFIEDFERLAEISLDPARHTAPNARAHCEQVAGRVNSLAQRHGCTPIECSLLITLARVHDIGKLGGDARPAASVERLQGYGVEDPKLLALVKAHDLNLPWWQAWRRGEAPTERAWGRLSRRVDLRLLALFMIADRVDAPGGWRANAPLMWFLEEAKSRGLLSLELTAIDEPGSDHGSPKEQCAGAMLVRAGTQELEALLIRVRAEVWELPKGHIEPGEDAPDAAARELQEETGVVGPVRLHARIGSRRYSFQQDLRRIDKHVEYFTFYGTNDSIRLGQRPRQTRGCRWVALSQLPAIPLVSEDLRSLLADGFALVQAHRLLALQQPES